MWTLGTEWCDEHALADAWRAAQPFGHLIFEDVVPRSELAALLTLLDEEPIDRYDADIFAFEASAPEPKTEALRNLRASFIETFAAPLARVTGKSLTRVDMRVYAYRAGHYLLPHADHQTGVGRALAFAYYVPSPEPPDGGELELYRCVVDAGEIVATESACVIEPLGNRLVVFDVSDVSLHQVREVLAGLRISVSGWFYP
mgnify:CR=1 FL=1